MSLALCVSLLAQSAPPPASSPQQPVTVAAPPPVFRSETRLVVVDVVVTDNHGKPVTGLKKEDFTVKENGQEQIIKSFEAHAPVAPTQAQIQEIAKLKLPPNIYTNVPLQVADSSINIVLFDIMNTPMQDQMFAREQMLQFLKTLPAGQRVGLFVLGSKLHMISGFTTNSTQLLTAARKVVPHSSEWLDTEDDKLRAEDQITEMEQGSRNPAFFDSMRDFLADDQQFRTQGRIEMTLSAFDALARGVSGFSGRKNLLWLSEGFPVDFGPGMDLHLTSYTSLLRETSGLLSSAQIAVYPIDIGGLKTTGAGANTSGLSSIGFRKGRSRYGTLLSQQGQSIEGAHAAMDEIAKETGGKAYYNTNDIKSAMKSSLERGTSYYSIAYTPENRNWDSRYRKVQVKVNQPGVKEDYRKGYFAMPEPKAEQEDGQRLVAAMQPGMPDATMLIFGAKVIPLKPGEQTANIAYILGAHQVAFTETPDQRKHGKIELVAVAWDKDNKAAGSTSQTLEMDLKPETYQTSLREGIRSSMQIKLNPGDYKLRLGIMDDGTGKLGTIEVPLQVAGPAPAAK